MQYHLISDISFPFHADFFFLQYVCVHQKSDIAQMNKGILCVALCANALCTIFLCTECIFTTVCVHCNKHYILRSLYPFYASIVASFPKRLKSQKLYELYDSYCLFLTLLFLCYLTNVFSTNIFQCGMGCDDEIRANTHTYTHRTHTPHKFIINIHTHIFATCIVFDTYYACNERTAK